MNLFDKLVDEALRNQSKFSNLRPVVEKELLHHDILKILNEHGILKHLTFMGGTALRTCYGAIRLSEDLDFTGGISFSRENLYQMGNAITQNINKKYGFKVTVSDPQKDSTNVATWKVKITTRPEQNNLPVQRINIDICSLPSYEKRPMLLINPYGVDMGTSGLIIQVQSLEEIYTDKIIAFALRPNRIKYRDLWDIMWLKQRGIVPKMELLPIKLKDRNCNINYFLDLVDKRLESLKDTNRMKEFTQEMQRFLPPDQLSTLGQQGMLTVITNLISETSLKFSIVKAAYVGDIKLVKQLISEGIDVNKQDPYDGKTALHWAATFVGCSGYQDAIVKLLLEARAKVNIRDKENHTPLYYAAQNSLSLEAVQNLSEGADESNITEASNIAQFGGAITDSRTKIVEYLLPKVHSSQPNHGFDAEDYKDTINHVEELYEKYIKNLYYKQLSIKDLEEVIKKLSADEHLKTFRRLYKGSNHVKGKVAQKKQNFLNTEIKKFDTEIIPAYYIMQYLHVNTIRFSSTQQNNKGYDALLTLAGNIKKRLEFTRAVDDGEEDKGQQEKKSGKQEKFSIELIRQDGSATQGGRVERRVERIDEVDEVWYVQPFPRAEVNLHSDIHPKMLLKAWEGKKRINDENHCYDWLVITISADPTQPKNFFETCEIFYQKVLESDNIGFERIFVFCEDDKGDKTFKDSVWDSKASSLNSK